MPAKKKALKPSESGKKAQRSYKAEMLPFVEINEGASITGTFQNRRMITIRDRITKDPKDIWIYSFRDVNNGSKFAVSGRTMLDQAFDAMFEAEGGIEKIIGREIRIERGEDSNTSAGFNLGTYEVSLLEL